MKIGTSITLRVNNMKLDETDVYKCQIIDKDEQYLYLDYPINIKTNKSMFIRVNETITVDYVENEIAYKFNSSIAKHVKLAVPALAIPLPEKDETIKIQRREFVRIKTNADVAIHFQNESFPPLTSVTYDISGGGVAVIVPPNVQMDEKQNLTLYLVLHFETNHYEYIKVEAKFIRFQMHGKVNTASLKFLLNSERDQEKIINYCFAMQRKKRKQGLI